MGIPYLDPSIEELLWLNNANNAPSGRDALRQLLSDGNTVAWYQPGVGVTGTLTASAWANQMGAAPSLATGVAPIYLPYSWTKYAYFSGVAANDFTTPNAAANQITGDIDIRVDVALDSWTAAGGARTDLMGKWEVANAYLLGMPAAAATLDFSWVDAGSASHNIVCSAVNGITDGTRAIVRVTLLVSTGAVTFYKSLDGGASWSQIGNVDTSVGATSIKSTAAIVRLGARDATSSLAKGKWYRGQIYNGINGTLAVDFNASDWSETLTNGATATSSTTGEVWTLNNTAIATPAAIVANPFIVTNESTMWLRSTYTANQPRTYYMVGYQPVWAAGKYVADGVTANTLGLSKTTGTPKLSLNAGSAAAENAGFTLRAKHVLTVVLNGASSSTAIDSVAAVTGDAGAGNPGGLTIGADGGTPTAGTFGGFWFSEIIDRDGADSAAKQLAIQNKLKQLHGTP